MTLKSLFDNPEEIFIGAMLQFPLIFIVGWWVIPIQLVCGLLWRYGGAEGGSKLARRIGVPFVVLLSSALVLNNYMLFIALPFMIWAAPSYGASGKLFNFFLKLTSNGKKADILTRGLLYVWYWAVYAIVLIIAK